MKRKFVHKRVEVILSNYGNAVGRKKIYFPNFFFYIYHSALQTLIYIYTYTHINNYLTPVK